MQTNKQELVICIILWFMFDSPVFSKGNYYILLITYGSGDLSAWAVAVL